MATKKTMSEDEKVLHALVDEIMTMPIPQPTSLSNPLANNKRKVKMSEHGTISRPDNVEDWNVRHLLDYFAERYKQELGKQYRKAFQADQHVFHQVTAFMSSNGLDKMEWSKKLVDWGFDNLERVILHQKHISPQSLLRMVNYFMQEEVMPLVEDEKIERDKYDESLIDEINAAVEAGKRMEIFSRHGIPVGVTYLVNCKKYDEVQTVESFSKFLKDLQKTEEGRVRIRRMIMASILGSPYPKEFRLLDWRKHFSFVCDAFYSESWWRDVDYSGKPMSKYYALLEENE